MTQGFENVVTLYIDAATYAILVRELGFLASIPDFNQHSRQNAYELWEGVMKAGRVTANVQADMEQKP